MKYGVRHSVFKSIPTPSGNKILVEVAFYLYLSFPGGGSLLTLSVMK